MHKMNSKPAAVLSILFLLLLITDCAPKLKNKVLALETAHNSHNMKELIEFYSEDSKFVLVGGWTAEGREKLKERFEWDFAVNGSLNFINPEQIGNTVTCKVEERNDWFKMIGIDVVHYEYTAFIFEDGLIREIQAKLAPNSIEHIEKAYSLFINWASKKHPAAIENLKSEGQFSFTKEKAGQWFTLLQIYQDEIQE